MAVVFITAAEEEARRRKVHTVMGGRGRMIRFNKHRTFTHGLLFVSNVKSEVSSEFL